jgi:hypothetical protein
MAIWSRSSPPIYKPDAILTRYGWTDPVTGELLIPLFDPSMGPGKNIRQWTDGTARIVATVVRSVVGRTKIVPQPQVRSVRTMVGTARILSDSRCYCPIPTNTGINPSW